MREREKMRERGREEVDDIIIAEHRKESKSTIVIVNNVLYLPPYSN